MTQDNNHATGDITPRLLDLAYQVIEQTYYQHLDQFEQTALRDDLKKIRPGDITCLFRVTELVFKKERGNLDAFRTVLNALHACGSTCLMLLVCREGRIELYLGAVNKSRRKNPYYLSTIREILSTGLRGNLPGSEIKEVVRKQDINEILEECLAESFDSQCITSVSCVASPLKKDDPIVGLEKLTDAVGDKNFSLLVLADPVDSEHVQMIRSGYEGLATELSEYESTSRSVQSSKSKTLSFSRSRSFSESLSNSISDTQSQNISNGWSHGENNPDRSGAAAGKKLAVGVGALKLAELVKQPMAGFATMSMASAWMNGGTQNDSVNQSISVGKTVTIGDSVTKGVNKQVGSNVADGVTYGLSVQTTRKDRHIQELLSKIDAYLKWLNRCENYGMFNCGTYVISSSASTNLLVASQYQALMQGEEEISHMAIINTWTERNDIHSTRDFLLHLMHPTVLRENTEFSPAMLISSKELARQMTLPQSSIVGVSVMEYASFGREVVRKSPMETGKVLRIGFISHMGMTMRDQPVLLDLQSLAAHTFVAGTNGSGKSNTIFKILEELMQNGIPFLVIEPAKGEYKNVFGAEKNVCVYGTNRNMTPLLRLNPFWFSDDIDIREHIARLMDVFQASWPMYAAMPSVLNSAIENAYRSCGWNLNTSRCIGRRVFPTVRDVLEELGRKMEATAFSDEVKGNYTGALSTRMEALTNGLYADMFSGADLGDQRLFESNVIIDLSRAGSAEVSAMIMGMLLIRLQEYRLSKGALNHALRHVTVLEEAHHLLKKTSSAQSEDSSNLMGKAVEMISNAIAEMRSYGDGFIIADQSPGLLDASVLRNTNTKLILRLPEGGDRELVGNTMSLNPKQAQELSRLKTGIAAVYQKDWLEPVLCQVNLAEHSEELYKLRNYGDEADSAQKRIAELLLLPQEDGEEDEGEKLILAAACSGATKRKLLKMLSGERAPWRARARMVAEIYPLTMEMPYSMEGIEEWIDDVYGVNELERTELSRMVIAANAWSRAADDRNWEKIARLFYDDNAEADSLWLLRGNILELVLFGEGRYAGEMTFGETERIQRTLADGNAGDCLLAEAFGKYINSRKPRQKGELTPYSSIAWNYVGGDAAWKMGRRSLEQKDLAAWDRVIRQSLRRSVCCGERTEDELLSLALQFKGSRREVQEFYYTWIAWRRKSRSEEALY